MKKPILYSILGTITVLVLAAAAAPKVIGSGVRDATMNSMLELLPAESRSQLQITETRFDSGWFSSEGELDIRYTALAEQEILPCACCLTSPTGQYSLLPTDYAWVWLMPRSYRLLIAPN